MVSKISLNSGSYKSFPEGKHISPESPWSLKLMKTVSSGPDSKTLPEPLPFTKALSPVRTALYTCLFTSSPS